MWCIISGFNNSRHPWHTGVVKAMVFPIVMYGFESWTIKKAEHQRIDASECGAGKDS